MLSIVDVANEFLIQEEKVILSEVLINNGFDSVEDKKFVYQSFEDKFSYGQLVKHLSSRIKEVRIGGEYPWDN